MQPTLTNPSHISFTLRNVKLHTYTYIHIHINPYTCTHIYVHLHVNRYLTVYPNNEPVSVEWDSPEPAYIGTMLNAEDHLNAVVCIGEEEYTAEEISKYVQILKYMSIRVYSISI